jgi:transposase-like protein
VETSAQAEIGNTISPLRARATLILQATRQDGNSIEVNRPPFEILKAEIEQLGYTAVGRKYGVSDNAVRKWMKAYSDSRG